MIIDNIANYKNYPFSDIWNTAFNYLSTLTPYTKDGKYEIKGEDVFAIVSSYETKPHHRYETHKEYLDIQYMLKGEEILKYTPSQELAVDTPFDESKDLTFFKGTGEGIPLHLKPGVFAALFPNEAHMPGVNIDTLKKVKKIVIKIRANML